MYHYYAHRAVNAALDVNGFRQGGLGDGVTNINSTHWNSWNNRYPFISCGHSDSLASGTGEVDFTMPDGYNSAEGLVTKVNRYRGVEMPFGHIWKNSDGINIRAAHAADADPTHRVYISSNPAHWNDSNYNNMTDIGVASRVDGYIKEMIPGHLLPLVSAGAGSTMYWCDYGLQNIPPSAPVLRVLLLGGNARDGAGAGLGCLNSNIWPAKTTANVGSRLCFI